MPSHMTSFNAPQHGVTTSASQTSGPSRDQRRDSPHAATQTDLAGFLQVGSIDELGQQLALGMSERSACRVLTTLFQPRRKRFRLIGDSQGLEKPRLLASGDPIEQVLTESRILASSVDDLCCDPVITVQTQIQAELAHQKGVTKIQVQMLADDENRLQGAILFLSNQERFQEKLVSMTGYSMAPLASCLKLRREAAATWWDRLISDLFSVVRSNRTKVYVFLALATALLLACPVPFQVEAHCQCEPTTRRILTAPFDAQLDACLVKPGDRVSEGQLLAKFDGRTIANEIESLAAEEKQAKQNYDAAVVKGESARATEAMFDLERLDGRLRVLRRRQSKLDLRSSINGVIVSGDLEEAIGATVSTGQRLFELAPLDHLTAEIEIDEADVHLVNVGGDVLVEFDGSPGESYTARLERIYPRAEMRDGENVFVAEASINGNLRMLSPGMRGQAQVDVGWRPLAWRLFRTPYHSLRRFWGHF